MESVKKYKVKPILSVKESDLLAGILLEKHHVKTLITGDADVYDAESGKCLAKYRKGVIPPKMQVDAYGALLRAAKSTSSRSTSKGKDDVLSEKASRLRIRQDGSVSKTVVNSEPVESGIIGYFDRTPRHPYCRLTAFNEQELSKFKKAMPIIKFVDTKYRELMPDHYRLQKEIASHTSKDFVITDTAFTTVTVNRNWQTAVHKDAGDYEHGFGNLLALRHGTYTGGWLCLPRWGVGFDLQNGDLLLMDVHQWHGNTPIVLDDPKAIRLSLVMYYRQDMINCGTMAQELERVKRRQRGEKLS